MSQEDYQPNEKVIKDGTMLLKFRESPYYGEVKDIIESEIRTHIRVLIANDSTQEELKISNAQASALMSFLEMVDGKIADMEVWLEQQQRGNEQDLKKVDEMVSFHRQQDQRRNQEARVM